MVLFKALCRRLISEEWHSCFARLYGREKRHARASQRRPPAPHAVGRRLSQSHLSSLQPRRPRRDQRHRRAALKMIRRHRILELYLTQHLGYDWGGVHAEAEQLEHAVSDDLIERMASALGHPLYDPHGDPIPTAAGEIEEAELVSLAEAPVGLKLELRQVGTQQSERLRYLAEQGLTPGVLLTVSERQPFNGPTTIALVPSRDPRVVGRELAQGLWCREVPVDGYGPAAH